MIPEVAVHPPSGPGPASHNCAVSGQDTGQQWGWGGHWALLTLRSEALRVDVSLFFSSFLGVRGWRGEWGIRGKSKEVLQNSVWLGKVARFISVPRWSLTYSTNSRAPSDVSDAVRVAEDTTKVPTFCDL